MKPEKSLGNEEAIRSLIDNWVSALRAKDLDKLMFKALAVDRTARFQTAGEFQEAILRVAHKNALMCSASELSRQLRDVCDPIEE